MTLTTVGRKIEILKQKKLLKDSNYYIKEDYPQNILEKRRMLQEQVKVERDKGNKAILKYDKIVIIGKQEINNRLVKSKRSLPTSPQETDNRIDSSPRTQPKKKNKPASNTSQGTTSCSENVVKAVIFNYLANKNSTKQVLPKHNPNQ
uniref:Endonuclease-reverse transcriptase n=1 Tax=Bombyx mori TaxID=7091 RepID=A0A8R2R2E2_BOMMO|nr:uncharacterized protein LOC119629404 [Bombyx mori]